MGSERERETERDKRQEIISLPRVSRRALVPLQTFCLQRAICRVSLAECEREREELQQQGREERRFRPVYCCNSRDARLIVPLFPCPLVLSDSSLSFPPLHSRSLSRTQLYNARSLHSFRSSPSAPRRRRRRRRLSSLCPESESKQQRCLCVRVGMCARVCRLFLFLISSHAFLCTSFSLSFSL